MYVLNFRWNLVSLHVYPLMSNMINIIIQPRVNLILLIGIAAMLFVEITTFKRYKKNLETCSAKSTWYTPSFYMKVQNEGHSIFQSFSYSATRKNTNKLAKSCELCQSYYIWSETNIVEVIPIIASPTITISCQIFPVIACSVE